MLYEFRDSETETLKDILESLGSVLEFDAAWDTEEDRQKYLPVLTAYLQVHDRLLALYQL